MVAQAQPQTVVFPSIQDIQDGFSRSAASANDAYRNFINANPRNRLSYDTKAGRIGNKVALFGEQTAEGLTGKTALGLGAGLAGLNAALSGGGFGEVVGAGSGAAAGTAIAGKLIPVLARGGPLGALAAGATALALPMLGSNLAGGVGRALDKGPFATVGSAMQQGGQTNINNALNPSNSIGSILENSLGSMSKQSREYAELLKRMGYDSQDVAAYGVQKVAIPLLNHQANLRAKMLPLDTAARLAQQSNQNIGQMFNTSIAGTSGIAQQIAANNPYGQVMI